MRFGSRQDEKRRRLRGRRLLHGQFARDGAGSDVHPGVHVPSLVLGPVLRNGDLSKETRRLALRAHVLPRKERAGTSSGQDRGSSRHEVVRIAVAAEEPSKTRSGRLRKNVRPRRRGSATLRAHRGHRVHAGPARHHAQERPLPLRPHHRRRLPVRPGLLPSRAAPLRGDRRRAPRRRGRRRRNKGRHRLPPPPHLRRRPHLPHPRLPRNERTHLRDASHGPVHVALPRLRKNDRDHEKAGRTVQGFPRHRQRRRRRRRRQSGGAPRQNDDERRRPPPQRGG
mmetsp:Transcript_22494/g.69222  ORF Transcript_22494/g.69222 Transcript_22494/m.69222 type:complete len:282 (-) Transcript_22494:295-1140(-)